MSFIAMEHTLDEVITNDVEESRYLQLWLKIFFQQVWMEGNLLCKGGIKYYREKRVHVAFTI